MARVIDFYHIDYICAVLIPAHLFHEHLLAGTGVPLTRPRDGRTADVIYNSTIQHDKKLGYLYESL